MLKSLGLFIKFPCISLEIAWKNSVIAQNILIFPYKFLILMEKPKDYW